MVPYVIQIGSVNPPNSSLRSLASNLLDFTFKSVRGNNRFQQSSASQQQGSTLDRDDTADGNVMREAQLDEMMKE